VAKPVKPPEKKLPWEPFFPADWLKAKDLRMCSLAARGAWIDFLSYMLASGVDHITGTVIDLARALGTTYEEAESAILELIHKGVCDSNVTTETSRVTLRSTEVTLISRRLARKLKSRDNHAKRQARYRAKRQSDAAVGGGEVRDHMSHVRVPPPPPLRGEASATPSPRSEIARLRAAVKAGQRVVTLIKGITWRLQLGTVGETTGKLIILPAQAEHQAYADPVKITKGNVGDYEWETDE